MTVLGLRMSMGLHRGWHRLLNEDYLGCYYPSDYQVLRERGVLFALADGVSTLENGAEASEYAVRHLLEQYYTQSSFRSVTSGLEAAMHQVNTDFRKFYPDSGTTLVGVVVQDQQLTVAHVGDSRAYWRDARDLQCLTRDHVLRVQRPDGRWVGKLTRSIGQAENMNVEISTRGVRTGDRIFLLSDGVTRYLDDLTLRRMTEGSIEESVCAMVGASLEGGGVDNIGVLVVDVGKSIGDQEALDAHRERLRRDGAFSIIPDQELEDCEESYRHTVPTAAEIAAAVHPLASRNWPVLLLLLTGLVGFAFTIMASTMILTGDTRVANPVLATEEFVEVRTSEPELIENTTEASRPEIGLDVRFSAAATAVASMNTTEEAFAIVPDSTYRIAAEAEDSSGTIWYQLLDVEANRYGWIQRDELPEYTILD